jgi:heme exporter protein D
VTIDRYQCCRVLGEVNSPSILASYTDFLRIPYAVFVWLGVRNSVLFAQELLLSSANSERSLLGRMTDGYESGAIAEGQTWQTEPPR